MRSKLNKRRAENGESSTQMDKYTESQANRIIGNSRFMRQLDTAMGTTTATIINDTPPGTRTSEIRVSRTISEGGKASTSGIE